MHDDAMTGGPRILRVASQTVRPTSKKDEPGRTDADVPGANDAAPATSAPVQTELAAEPGNRQVRSERKTRRLSWAAVALAGACLLGVIEVGIVALPKLGLTIPLQSPAGATAGRRSGGAGIGPQSKLAQSGVGLAKQTAPLFSTSNGTSAAAPSGPMEPQAGTTGPVGNLSPPAAVEAAPSGHPGAPAAQIVQSSSAAAAQAATVSDGPAPLTPDEQIELELAGKLRRLADQVSALDARMSDLQQGLDDRVASGMGTLGGRLDELQHRQDQMDQTLIHMATNTASKTDVQASNSTSPASSVAPVAAVARPPARSPKRARGDKPAVPARPTYRVQAGAPDIAILQDATGDATRVEPGSTIPGWGTVESISADDRGWVVKTSGGVIH